MNFKQKKGGRRPEYWEFIYLAGRPTDGLTRHYFNVWRFAFLSIKNRHDPVNAIVSYIVAVYHLASTAKYSVSLLPFYLFKIVK